MFPYYGYNMGWGYPFYGYRYPFYGYRYPYFGGYYRPWFGRHHWGWGW